MKSKTSFFNPTLYKKNLTRFWPLWGLTAFFAALIPLAGVMMYLNGDLKLKAVDFEEVYYAAVAYAAPTLLLCYSVLCAMAVWSYLYNARSVGMMHTLPISREGLFVTNFLSGLTMVAIPWFAAAVVSVILSIMAKSFTAGPLFLTALCIFGEGVLYFSTATAAAFITGNIFALPALYFLFHFLAPLLDMLITQFSANMIFGLQSRDYTGVADWLSPTVYITKNVRPHSVYTQVQIRPDVTQSVVESVTLEKAWIIALYALLGLALLGAAYVLYRYRKSESAGEVIAMQWGRPVFRYGIAALCALGGGQLLYLIIFSSFDMDTSAYHILPLIFCMLVGGLIGYYGASMLLAKTLRVFKGSERGAAIVAAGCVLACCVVGFDILGVAKRVPTADEVKYVRLYAANNTYYLFPDEDADVIEALRDVQKSVIADKDYIRKRLADNRYSRDMDFSEYTFVTVRMSYYLKNGLTVDRNYRLYLSKDRMQEPGTFDNALDRLINSTEMKLRRLRFNDPRFIIDNGSISVEKREAGYEFSSRELSEVLAAIAEDAKAGTWGEYTWFEEDDSTYAVSMFFWYSINDIEELASRGMDNIRVTLRPGMTNTIDCLKKMGYLEDGDLVTGAEMQEIRKARAGYELKDYVEADLQERMSAGETLEDIIYPTGEVASETVGKFETPEASTDDNVTPETSNGETVTPEASDNGETVTAQASNDETVTAQASTNPATTPEAATVTPEAAPETTPVTNPDALNNPNSAPQTPAESSAASMGN